jgi:uncharacterized membrane protein
MYVYCDSRACFARRNYSTKWVTQLQKLEEDSTAVKLVRLRMCVYTFVLKPVRLNIGVTLEYFVSFPLRMQWKTSICLYMLTSGYKYHVCWEILTVNNK